MTFKIKKKLNASKGNSSVKYHSYLSFIFMGIIYLF